MAIRHYDQWRRYKVDGDPDARADLIRQYVPLVHYVLKRTCVDPPITLERDDLVAVGTLGMISAVQSFDHERGLEFTTFAVPRIRGAILDELRKHDWVPRTVRRRQADVRAAVEVCRDESGRADMCQVADQIDLAPHQVARLLAFLQPASFVPLDRAENSESPAIAQAVPDAAAVEPDSRAELLEQCRTVLRLLAALPEPQQSVIREYYFEQREQKDIATDLRLSRSRISQIHKSALANLRRKMEALGAA
ncbi:MAG: sigma-70 family RNA polymerase sigma factor [Planctomycetota bacterium]